MTSTQDATSEMAGPVPRWVVTTAVAGTIVIALGAFWLSFTALTDLAERAGIPAGQAWVWPLIVDGLIVVATVSVVALSSHGRRAIWYPWLLLITGAVVSVSANALHALLAADHTVPQLLAAAVSAVPPLVLLAITHLTVELTRHAHPPRATTTAIATAPPDPVHDAAEATVTSMDATSRRHAARLHRKAGWSNKRIATHLGVHPSTVGRWFNTPARQRG